MEHNLRVGVIVHYHTRGSADGIFPPTVFAAIVTQVSSDVSVDLVTFGPSGIRFELMVGKGDGIGQWSWPEDDRTGEGGGIA